MNPEGLVGHCHAPFSPLPRLILAEVAFTSNAALAGVDLYAIEPYDIADPTSWNIPVNLDAFVNETTYSLDWWAQTVNNHSSHVAADTASATLWRFGTTATSLGSVTVQLHKSG